MCRTHGVVNTYTQYRRTQNYNLCEQFTVLFKHTLAKGGIQVLYLKVGMNFQSIKKNTNSDKQIMHQHKKIITIVMIIKYNEIMVNDN